MSSKYSNSNTACTRDLFIPSEENCLNQHLANYSSKKPRIISESDLIHLKRRESQRTPSLCNTVEEEMKEEIKED